MLLENADKECMKRMNVTGCGTISWTEKRQNIYLFQSRCCSIVFNVYSEKRLCKLLGPIFDRGLKCGADRETALCPTGHHKTTTELRGEVSQPRVHELSNS